MVVRLLTLGTRGFRLAVVLFIAYTVIAIAGGLFLFVATDLGTETTTTERRDAQNVVLEQTRQERESIPVLAVFTALAAGGWLLIPLKFAWDQLAKESEAERQEMLARADDRREIAAKMRELVFGTVGSHFGPMLYRLAAVGGWARSCRSDQKYPDNASFGRLLYSVAQLCDSYERLKQQGTPIILRSRAAERLALETNMGLQDCVYSYLGSTGGEDFLLMKAVLSSAPGQPDGRRFVGFQEFQLELGQQPLKAVHDCFVECCKDPTKLEHLIACAETAYNALAAGLDDVYREWYGETQEPSSTSRMIEAPLASTS